MLGMTKYSLIGEDIDGTVIKQKEVGELDMDL
jgi:hypothetical protein